jgi:nucleoside phosphorylase
MSRLVVFAASDMEGRAIGKTSSPHELALVIAGMGPRNAKAKAEAVLGDASKPDAVAVIGLCGGLVATLPEGTIVTYKECLSTDMGRPPLPCSPTITNAMMEALTSSKIHCDRVGGITSRRIATSRNERLELARSGATVVDMESYSIMAVASAVGIPSVVVRVVADSIDRELPDLNRALNEAGGLDGRKALKVALGSPLRTARLLAANKRAMQRLTPALSVALSAQW